MRLPKFVATLATVTFFALPMPATADPQFECLSATGHNDAARVDWCTQALVWEAENGADIMDFEPDLLLARSKAYQGLGNIGAARADLKEARRITELLPEALLKVAAAMIEIGDSGNGVEAATLVAGYNDEDSSLALEPVSVHGIMLSPRSLAGLAECRNGQDAAARAAFAKSAVNGALKMACAAGFGAANCDDEPKLALDAWIGAMCPKP